MDREEQKEMEKEAVAPSDQEDSRPEEELTPEEQFADHSEVISLKQRLKGMSKDSMKKLVDELRLEISQMSSNIAQLKQARAEHNAQARHFRQMRNNVSADRAATMEDLREQAAYEKEQRDACNEEIRVNKQLREELKPKIHAAWAKVKELRAQYFKMKDEVGQMPEDIQKEIDELEWKQQTSSLTPEEDAELTRQIVELLEKIDQAESIGYSSGELDKAVEEAKALSVMHDEAHEKVVSYAQKSQEHHEKMLSLYQELDEFRSGGSDLHERFLEAREAADATHSRIVGLYERIKLNQYLLDLIDDEQTLRRQEQDKQLREERIAQTKEKSSSSKRLTLNELRLLMGTEDEEEEG